jgi:hypothetical protein
MCIGPHVVGRLDPKKIGYVGGAISAIAVVIISKPGSAIEAAKIGGTVCAVGFLVIYAVAGAAFLLFDAFRNKRK